MKGKLIQLLLSLLFWLSFLFLTGDLKKIAEKFKQKLPDEQGEVRLSGVRLDDDGVEQTLYFSIENATKDEILYTNECDLFVVTDGGKTLIPEKTAASNDAADVIGAGEVKDLSLRLSERFGRLSVGSYTLSKVFGVSPVEIGFTVTGR